MTSIFVIADLIDKKIVATRYANQDGRWTVKFEDAEVKGNGVLISEYGNADSFLHALRDYLDKIAGKTLVFNASHPDNRMEFTMPKHIGM